RDLDAQPVEQREVRSEFVLGGGLWREQGVTSLAERDTRRSDVVRLVLRVEARRTACRSVRRTDAEIAERAKLPERLFGYAPDAGDTAEVGPAVAFAEQRAAVATHGTVEDVAILVVQARSARHADVLDRLRRGGGRLERRHVGRS